MANHYTRVTPELSGEQRAELERWVRRSKTGQALARRTRVMLRCAEGKSDVAVAKELGTTRENVGKRHRRFLHDGCDGLLDEPRPGAPRRISDEAVGRLIVKTLEAIPPDLAGICLAAAPHGDLQALPGPAVHWEGVRHLSAPADTVRTSTFHNGQSQIVLTTSSDSISIPRSVRWPCAWTRNPRSRHWIALSRDCRFAPGCRSGAPTITYAMAPPRCSPVCIPLPGRSSDSATAATAPANSRSSSRPLSAGCPPHSTSTWCWTTTAPTKRR